MSPGIVAPIGWDLNTLGIGESIDYLIDPKLNYGTKLSVTLAWNRHVGRTDDGDGIVDAGDNFFVEQALSDLDLAVLKDGVIVAQSISPPDNVEHLFLDIDRSAQYTLRVFNNTANGAEKFALAWFGTAVPEPNSAMMLLVGVAAAAAVNRRHRGSSLNNT
jgi:hypothetical protein